MGGVGGGRGVVFSMHFFGGQDELELSSDFGPKGGKHDSAKKGAGTSICRTLKLMAWNARMSLRWFFSSFFVQEACNLSVYRLPASICSDRSPRSEINVDKSKRDDCPNRYVRVMRALQHSFRFK